MQKSGKVWSKGLSFFMVLVLAFTSVFFNSTPINAEVQTEKKFSGANVGLDLLRVTGKDSPFSENANATLKLIKGETYILTAKIGFQKEYGGGQWLSQLLTTIKEGDVKLFRNGKEKSSFDALTTASWLKNETDAEFEFIAGDDKINAATGEVKDFIEAKGKTGIWKNEIILSSYLIYNLKLKADFYYEGATEPFNSKIVDWNGKVKNIIPEQKDGYKFKGWYYRNEPNKKFNFDETITDNVELVAKYELKNNNEQQEEEQQDEVTVTFVADNKEQGVVVNKGSTFNTAKTKKQNDFKTAEENAKQNGYSNGNINVEKYDWYTDAQYKTIANDNERIDTNKTYYGQLKKEKVNVTFYVNDTKQEIVKIEKGKTFTDAKGLLSKFNDFDNYDWFLDKGFKENVDKNKAIDTFIIYYGKLKSTDNNNNNNNNDNNNNGNNNNGNNNNGNNNNDNNNNNNNNTTTPNTPSNDITIPEETTPLSPATTETSTTPATESKDNNDNIDIEDDDTALGTAVVDDKDATLPAKKENKIIAKKESSLNITSEDTPLGTTLPTTGGSFGIIYILFGLLLSAFGIKKFRER